MGWPIGGWRKQQQQPLSSVERDLWSDGLLPTSPFGPALTDESKLIGLLQLCVTCIALYLVFSCHGRQQPPAGGGMHGRGNDSGPQAPLITFSAVTAALLLFLGPPGSVDAVLELMARSPLPIGAVPAICVLSAALIVAFRFTSIAVSVPLDDAPAASLPSGDGVFGLIKSRRSIFPKDYSGAPVPRRVIERALEAANWAPTHGKTEPWRFAVFMGEAPLARFHAIKRAATERSLKSKPEKLAAALSKIDRKQAELKSVSAIIAIVLKRDRSVKGELMPLWEEQAAVACAMQNFHLQLTAEGFAGYWSSGGVNGWAEDEEVRALVGADGACDGERDMILGWFHVGASDKGAMYKARRGPIESKVTWIGEE